MGIFRILDIAGTAMNAQSVRLNATASNLANAESVSSSVETTYKARRPLFSAAFDEAMQFEVSEGGAVDPATGEPYGVGVALKGVIESDAPTIKEYNPNHPLADENGYIYRPNVNPVEEMADMISANRSYQTAVQMATSAKKMMQATLQIGTNPNM
ncbi:MULTISPECIES: flagellar basal body rod protein FlgC [Succinivibrio]|uniref:Flagellar basal-body rod protein FlgC n=1 Tax=Succinivibrio dextrinosolvens TaxID=83771 RepID=A0A662Z899_9GAMM|nr:MULTISPECIES: flagellar basal body rod protein FlgC [Succinivibrio]MBQ9220132.1 flagellar basal body rod protein FlgC [Succinivibrio sp.]SFK00066.1 flagellar basal-body rod protein FlgC [Succinivibrio dextrinosolvens]